MKILKRLYFWTLSWADSQYSSLGLFLVAFIESSVFPIPPDILLIPLVLGRPEKWFMLCSICTFGSVLGGLLGYGIGFFAMETVGNKIVDFLNLEIAVQNFFVWYEKYGDKIVLIGGFTPVPYKVITLLSGAVKLDVFTFIVYSLIGRAGRFFLLGVLLWFFGERIKAFIDRYFNILTIIFMILLIGGFFALKFL